MQSKKQIQKGFTLIEILVVILIIGLLVVFLLPRLNFTTGKSRDAGVKSDFHSFQVSGENYLREIAGKNPSETGLNGLLDSAMKATSGVSKMKDPWGTTYKIQEKTVSSSESILVIRSSGKDTASDSTDPFTYSGTTYDVDDEMEVIHYKNGVVKSCTKGLASDLGSVNLVNQSMVGTVTSDLDISSFKTTHKYVYAIDISYSAGTYRNYVGANVPLNIVHSSPDYEGTWHFNDSSNTPFDGMVQWHNQYDSYNDWWESPPNYSSMSTTLTNVTSEDVYQFSGSYWGFIRVQQVASGYAVSGCN